MNEIHLINNVIISEPNRYMLNICYPREEIAKPEKLLKVSKVTTREWNDNIYISQYKKIFYYAKINWEVKYKDFNNVHSKHFYILSECPSMFQFHNTNIKSYKEWEEWIVKYWSKPFLITTPVFKTNANNFIINCSKPQFSGEFYNASGSGSDIETIHQLLRYQSYTIGNGLILLLALTRLKKIKVKYVRNLVLNLFNMHTYLQPIYSSWSELYYGKIIPNIADFPWYYNIPDGKLLRILLSDYNNSIFIQYNNLTTSLQSSCFPDNLNEKLWDIYETYNKWPLNYYQEYPTTEIDIAGFIRAIVKNKTTWKWWMKNYIKYFDIFKVRRKTIVKMLIFIFHMYNTNQSNIRIKKLWNQVITFAYENNRNSFSLFVITYLSIHRNIPIPLLKDILYECDIFKKYRVTTSIFTYLRDENDPESFYNLVLKKKITFRLLILKQFGYEISNIMANWFKTHREYTIL